MLAAGPGTRVLRVPLHSGSKLPLVSLPDDAHLLAVRVDPGRIEVHELLGTQPRGVGELEHRAVAQVERGRRRDALEQLAHLGRLEHARQVLVLLGARHEVGRVGRQLAALDELSVEGPDRGQLAGDRRLRGAALRHDTREVAQLAVPELVRPEAAVGALPPVRVEVRLSHVDPAHRLITLESPDVALLDRLFGGADTRV